MLQYRILNDYLCRKWTPTSTPVDIVDKFIKLGCKYPYSYQRMLPLARAKYGWSWVEFYYYAADKRVKRDQIFEQDLKMFERPNSTIMLKERIDHSLKELSKLEGFTFSLTNVSKEVGCSERALRNLGYNKKIFALREEQKKHEFQSEERSLIKKFYEYKEQTEKENRPMLSKEVFNYIGKNQKYVTKNYPQLSFTISKTVEQYKLAFTEKLLREKEEEVKEAVRVLYLEHGLLNIRLVGKHLNINLSNRGQAKLRSIVSIEIERFINTVS